MPRMACRSLTVPVTRHSRVGRGGRRGSDSKISGAGPRRARGRGRRIRIPPPATRDWHLNPSARPAGEATARWPPHCKTVTTVLRPLGPGRQCPGPARARRGRTGSRAGLTPAPGHGEPRCRQLVDEWARSLSLAASLGTQAGTPAVTAAVTVTPARSRPGPAPARRARPRPLATETVTTRPQWLSGGDRAMIELRNVTVAVPRPRAGVTMAVTVRDTQ